MTILFCASPDSIDRIALVLGDTSVFAFQRELLEHLASEPGTAEDLVVIGPEVGLDQAVALTEQLRLLRPALGVILVRGRLEVAVLNRAMRAGMREVVGYDDPAELLAASERSRKLTCQLSDLAGSRLGESVGKPAHTVLVFSAKGGCGKTTLSTNLAWALAGHGRVCLVDLDLQFGDVAVALGIEPVKTIADAVRMREQLDDSGLESLLHRPLPDLGVLLAPIEPGQAALIDPVLVDQLLRALRERFDFVVVDAPPALNDTILKAFDLADEYLLLTTPDAPAIKNLTVTLGAFDELGLKRQRGSLVVNRATVAGGLGLEEVSRATGLLPRLAIPDSAVVPRAVNRGKPVLAAAPRHRVSRVIRQLAAEIAQAK